MPLTISIDNMWLNVENRRNFFIKYANSRGFDPLNPENWYTQTREAIMEAKVHEKKRRSEI
jgi:hypothetical protein